MSSMLLDQYAGLVVQVWRAVHLKPDSSLRRHLHPVCQLVYNSVYHEAISADESGLICVWKVSLSHVCIAANPDLLVLAILLGQVVWASCHVT